MLLYTRQDKVLAYRQGSLQNFEILSLIRYVGNIYEINYTESESFIWTWKKGRQGIKAVPCMIPVAIFLTRTPERGIVLISAKWCFLLS